MSDINVILSESNGTGTVRLCGCSCVHMTIGPVTMKMTPDMFVQAATMVRQAMDTLKVIVAAGETDEGMLPVAAKMN
jgi:hypothetical protein